MTGIRWDMWYLPREVVAKLFGEAPEPGINLITFAIMEAR